MAVIPKNDCRQVIILQQFHELLFFAQVKHRPGMFLGKASLLSLRDQLFGMDYAFSFHDPDAMRYFHGFVSWYHETLLDGSDAYACWWNHLLYTSDNDDVQAFSAFFNVFEQYLQQVHNLHLD